MVSALLKIDWNSKTETRLYSKRSGTDNCHGTPGRYREFGARGFEGEEVVRDRFLEHRELVLGHEMHQHILDGAHGQALPDAIAAPERERKDLALEQLLLRSALGPALWHKLLGPLDPRLAEDEV
eukprot:3463292-Rhodomonas_salina.5